MGKYKITLKLADDLGIIEYEEENEEVFREKLKSLSEIRDAALSILSQRVSVIKTSRQPVISKPQSLSDAISKLLSQPWGKVPRTLNELHDALATNAVHVRKEALGSLLTKMTKKGKLSRTKKGSVYAYTLPLRLRD